MPNIKLIDRQCSNKSKNLFIRDFGLYGRELVDVRHKFIDIKTVLLQTNSFGQLALTRSHRIHYN